MPEKSPPPSIRSWFADREWARVVLLNLGVALLIWGLAQLVLLPVVDGRRVTPIWPGVGFAVAVTYLGGYRLLPGVVLGSFALNYPREPLLWAAFVAASQVIHPLLVVRILRGLKFEPRLERVRDPIILSVVAGPAGALASGAFVIGVNFLAGRLESSTFFYNLWLWVLRDWLGTMVVASFIFSWVKGRSAPWTWPRIAEGVALMLIMFFGAQLIFGLWGFFADRDVPIAFMFFPIIGWAGLAVRSARRGDAGRADVGAAHWPWPACRSARSWRSRWSSRSSCCSCFSALASLSGHLLAAIMAERDDALERRLLLEEQLRHSQKMEAVGRLAGGIAHDFNNLLTAIIGYTEIVLTSLDPKDERRADAEEIGRAAMRAADLTRQMLAFSRRQVLQPKIIDLNTRAQQGRADAAPRASAKTS